MHPLQSLIIRRFNNQTIEILTTIQWFTQHTCL